MGKVFLDITMSLDGFVAGPNITIDQPLGDGGKRLHDWLFGNDAVAATAIDKHISNEMFASTGAFVMGRRTFDVGIGQWGPDGAFGKPCFVLTHRAEEKLVKGSTTFTFVTDGAARSLEQAKAVAGDKDICVMGGAGAAQEYLSAGFVDELRIHLVPVLFKVGTRLFDHIGTDKIELERPRIDESLLATHLRFRVIK